MNICWPDTDTPWLLWEWPLNTKPRLCQGWGVRKSFKLCPSFGGNHPQEWDQRLPSTMLNSFTWAVKASHVVRVPLLSAELLGSTMQVLRAAPHLAVQRVSRDTLQINHRRFSIKFLTKRSRKSLPLHTEGIWPRKFKWMGIFEKGQNLWEPCRLQHPFRCCPALTILC